jgi:hypothetical protein
VRGHPQEVVLRLARLCQSWDAISYSR